VDYEEFAADAVKSSFAREMIEYFERQNKIACLIAGMIQERPDEWLTQLLAQLPGCQPNQKVQIVLSNDKIKSRPDLKRKLAELLGVSSDDVMIIATAPGSMQVLLGLPPQAASRLISLSLPYNLDGYNIVSITAYPKLPAARQTSWQTAVTAVTSSTAAAIAAGGALGLLLKIFIGILVLIGLTIVGTAIWVAQQPDLTVENQCAAPLPIPDAGGAIRSLLSLPDEIPVGGSITVPILTGGGRYELAIRNNTMILILPKLLPIVGVNEVSIGQLDQLGSLPVVSFDGTRHMLPSSFEIEPNQAHTLVICAPE
jgi:hypothetical protein